MASWHCDVKNSRDSIPRTGNPTSAKAHYDYIAREGRYEKGERAEELVDKWSKNMPEWAEDDPGKFWEAADENERANGRTYTEIEVALPNELTPAQQKELLEEFCQELLGEDHAYSVAIHDKVGALDGVQKNPNGHIVFTERKHDGIKRDPEQFFKRYDPNHPERGGAKKDRDWNSREAVEVIKEAWERIQNRHLEMHGHEARVDRRSVEAQRQDALKRGDWERAAELDREREKHIGPGTAAQKDAPPKTLAEAEKIAISRVTNKELKRVKDELYQIKQALYKLGKEETANNRKKQPDEKEANRIEAERRELKDREAIAEARKAKTEEYLKTPEAQAEIKKHVDDILEKDQRRLDKLNQVGAARLDKLEKEHKTQEKRGNLTYDEIDRIARKQWEKKHDRQPMTKEDFMEIEKVAVAIRKDTNNARKKADELQAQINKLKGIDPKKEAERAAKAKAEKEKATERTAEVKEAMTLNGTETTKELSAKDKILSAEYFRLKKELEKLPDRVRSDQELKILAEQMYKMELMKNHQQQGVALASQKTSVREEIEKHNAKNKEFEAAKPHFWQRTELIQWTRKVDEHRQNGINLRSQWEQLKAELAKHEKPYVEATSTPEAQTEIKKNYEILKKQELERVKQIPQREEIQTEMEKIKTKRREIKGEIVIQKEKERLERYEKRGGKGPGFDPKEYQKYDPRIINPRQAIALLGQLRRSGNRPSGGIGSIKARILRDFENEGHGHGE